MSEMSIVPTARARQRRGAFAASLRACVLSAVLLFGAGTGVAQADPVRAEQIMHVVNNYRMGFDMNMRIAYMQIDARQYSASQVNLVQARMQVMQIAAKLAELEIELKHSRENGLYTNLAALDRAILECDVAQAHAQMLSTRVLQLQMVPSSVFNRQLLEVQRTQFNLSMTKLEQAMAEA